MRSVRVLYLSAGRSQQNINDEITDGGKVVKRTWRKNMNLVFLEANMADTHRTHWYMTDLSQMNDNVQPVLTLQRACSPA